MSVFKSLFVLLPSLLLFTGCLSSDYYILSHASTPASTCTGQPGSIGVEKVEVPQYLFKRNIAVAASSSRITFLHNAVWAEALDEGLTRRLISFLQKKFQQPQVYGYPWGSDTAPRIKLHLVISRFIVEGNYAYLDASIVIQALHGTKQRARLFTTTVPVREQTPTGIVEAMDRAFGKLEAEIARTLCRF
jgi:cholesterol transport system auxiliary component